MTGILDKVKHLIWPSSPSKPSPSEQRNRQKKSASTGTQAAETSINLSNEFYQGIFLSETLFSTETTVPQSLVLQVVEDKLKGAEFRNKAIPRLPSVVPQLLRSLRDPKSSANEYVAIIKQDPVIAAAVLKMANSAYFNPANQRIDSFQRAVVALGIEGLRSLLSTAVMQPIIQCKSHYFVHFGKKLWDHSLCCAVSCQIIAPKQGQDPFKAYLTGLIHDIGKITIFTQLSQQFKLNKSDNKPPAHAFVKLMDKMGMELSYAIAKDWSFPDEITKAIKEQIGANDSSRLSPLGDILYRSNQACEAYMLMQAEILSPSQAEMVLQRKNMPDNLFEQLDSIYSEIN